jgi:hypothetical protein
VTTLHDAAKFGDEEAVRKLLEEGKDVDEPVSVEKCDMTWLGL